METNTPNAFVLILFSLGWFLVFCFSSENRKQYIYKKSNRTKEREPPTRARARKKTRSRTWGISADLIASSTRLEKIAPFLVCFFCGTSLMAVDFLASRYGAIFFGFWRYLSAFYNQNKPRHTIYAYQKSTVAAFISSFGSVERALVQVRRAAYHEALRPPHNDPWREEEGGQRARREAASRRRCRLTRPRSSS